MGEPHPIPLALGPEHHTSLPHREALNADFIPIITRIFWFFWASLGAQTGCTDDSVKAPNDPAAAGSPVGSGGSASGASASGASASGGSGGAGASNLAGAGTSGAPVIAVTKFGFFVWADTMSLHELAAYFSVSDYWSSCPAATTAHCSYTRKDSCHSTTEKTSGRVRAVRAGTLALTSSGLEQTVTMTPDPANEYRWSGALGSLGGLETMRFAASGGTVPAFSADMTAPLALLLDSPASSLGGEVTVDKSKDLVLTFSRGTPGVSLMLQANSSNGALDCAFPSEDGSATIPAAALQALGAGATIEPWTYGKKMLTAGDFTIDVGAVMDVATPSKSALVKISVR